MPKYPKNFKSVDYYVFSGKRKRRVAGSTKATSDFLVVVHEQHPTCTIRQLRDLLTDRTQYIFQTEAVAVCDAHISAGYGDDIPNWR